MILQKQLLAALLLGIATSLIVAASTGLPYSRARDALTDVLTLPGGLIARLMYPAGIHTGSGAPHWGLIAWAANVLIYILLWYIVIRFSHRFRSPSTTNKS